MKTSLTLKSFCTQEWYKNWAGPWSFLSCSYFGHQYTETIKKFLGIGFEITMFISKKGYSIAYFEVSDLEHYGKTLAKKIEKNEKFGLLICSELKKKTDAVFSCTKNLHNKKIGNKAYKNFLKCLYEYGAPHRGVKMVVDFLPEKTLKKLLPKFEEARLYAEQAYVETEKIMNQFAAQIGTELKIKKELILYLTKEELNDYLSQKKIPSKKILESRYKKSALLFHNGKQKVIIGKDVIFLEKSIENTFKKQETIKGAPAFPGKTRGIAIVTTDPKTIKNCTEKNILVTNMTRPEYLHLIQKASGFLTDAGGMLSHAAITARELKKPCIVGTQVATKIIRNGDEIEMDATTGVIKILKRK